MTLTFNRPYATGREFEYIREAIENRHLSGNGPFDRRCCEWLERRTGSPRAFLTSSGTLALEMAAMLAGVGPGDEVIMPSFTFVTTASAFVRHGATPVFVDVRPDTLNLDERLVEEAVGERTRAIVPVHYAGVGCEMDTLGQVAAERELLVIEDAAQAVMSSYKGRALGSLGTLGCLSFHETKNVTAGEAGALLVGEESWIERAEIVQEKGTDRMRFFRGEVDRYTWIELGSSFVTSEVNAAFLWAQLEEADSITARRMGVWDAYHERLAGLEQRERLRRPVVPPECEHNAHMYYVLLPDGRERDALIEALAGEEIQAIFHYVPLHSSPAGRRYGRAHGGLEVTDDASARLLRLPLWVGMTTDDVERVVGVIERELG